MARKGIPKSKFHIPYLKVILLSGLISALYFLSGLFLVSDVGPMWTFYFYYPIVIVAFAVGYGGGPDSRLYSLLFGEFILLWILIFCMLMIIRFFINLIRPNRDQNN